MIKFLNTIAILACFVCESYAKSDSVYITTQFQIVNKEQAEYKLILADRQADTIKASCFDMNNLHIWEGHFIGKNTLVRHGRFEYFDKNDLLERIEHYQFDKKEGEYIQFKHGETTISETRMYHSGDGSYSFNKYNESGDCVVQSGSYDAFEQKNSNWIEYFPQTKQIKKEENFQHGKKSGWQKEYYESNQLKRKELFEYGKLRKKSMYDENGKRMKYYPAFQYPSNKEPLYKYLYRKVPCFEACVKRETFEISFFVDKQGHLSDVKIDQLKNLTCAESIKQAILIMPNWIPAKIENLPISMRYKKSFKPYTPKE